MMRVRGGSKKERRRRMNERTVFCSLHFTPKTWWLIAQCDQSHPPEQSADCGVRSNFPPFCSFLSFHLRFNLLRSLCVYVLTSSIQSSSSSDSFPFYFPLRSCHRSSCRETAAAASGDYVIHFLSSHSALESNHYYSFQMTLVRDFHCDPTIRIIDHSCSILISSVLKAFWSDQNDQNE